MKVSIIIPCYNSEAYLNECMASVIAQTFEDFEAILIDDGSSDHTAEIALGWAQRDARVRVLKQENRGVSAARNLGLCHAQGEWVTFVDSDDLLMPHALETMLSAADETVDMVVCAHRTFTQDGHTQTVIPESRWMDKRGEAKRRAVALRLIEGDQVLNIMCNKLHRRALLEREGLRLREGIKLAEDALFNLEAALCGRGVAYVNRVTYLYRTHAASVTQSQTAGEFDRHLPWMRALGDLLARRGVLETYYGAYLDTVVLRLYKDGGVGGVVKEFKSKARPLLLPGGMEEKKMSTGGRLLCRLVRSGAYPLVYPLIYPAQVIRRKTGEAAFALRKGKETPDE